MASAKPPTPLSSSTVPAPAPAPVSPVASATHGRRVNGEQHLWPPPWAHFQAWGSANIRSRCKARHAGYPSTRHSDNTRGSGGSGRRRASEHSMGQLKPHGNRSDSKAKKATSTDIQGCNLRWGNTTSGRQPMTPPPNKSHIVGDTTQRPAHQCHLTHTGAGTREDTT